MAWRDSRILELKNGLAADGRFDGSAELLGRMVDRASRVAGYAEDLDNWLEGGSTLKLRIAVRPFGDYWESLAFANEVDGLDATMAQIGEVQNCPDASRPSETGELSL